MTFDEQSVVHAVYGEVHGEPEEGQRAIPHVLPNRLRDGRWGKTLAKT